jgi:hypothetical protein
MLWVDKVHFSTSVYQCQQFFRGAILKGAQHPDLEFGAFGNAPWWLIPLYPNMI